MGRKFISTLVLIVVLLSGAQILDLQRYGLEILDIKRYDIESILRDFRRSDTDRNTPAVADLPGHPGYPTIAGTYEFVEHTHFALSYNEAYEQPNWVMYQLTKDMLKPSKFKRKDNFRVDPTVDTGSATKKDYVKSGYDRGHLVPAADMKFSKDALSETFYMSNMSPQKPGFNRGMWKALESQVRDWAKNDDDYYIVVGPVFQDEMAYIGENDVAVPSYYYKIIVDLQEPDRKAIAFLMENTKLAGELNEYCVTIDSIEQMTGIDFFPELPDDFENWLEGQMETGQWTMK
ncbi:MAG: DNA/RNA non-specific endonuclease [Calditrichaeota bacterium]|nr:MAG: DNA/RNA non-specific endonuclease [Calditrichota bacterium]